MLSFLFWPVMVLIRAWKKRRRPKKAKCSKVVILGLDGLSPYLVEKYWQNGDLANFKKLADSGTYRRMRTTTPGVSPVAWSSFQTGVNPGKHGIFDFLAPDRKRYLAVLSSVKTATYKKKNLLGRVREEVSSSILRMSKPFWSLLGKYGIRSTILRVPITYPPEPLDGRLLSGMCVPDLRGSQGSYTLFTTEGTEKQFTGGISATLHSSSAGWYGDITGPEGCAPVRINFRKMKTGQWKITSGTASIKAAPGKLSEWLTIEYKAGRTKVRGISRFRITEEDNIVVYCTALHVDPSGPVVPLSHPVHYSRYLAGAIGKFATLGLAEDTWALSNGHLDEKSFLDMAWAYFAERKRMFRNALKNGGDGLTVCVFDTSDRIQHMFWGNGIEPGSVIHSMYLEMDKLVGEIMDETDGNQRLIVMSDHGFTSFHTCIDFNRWLVEEGYMVLEDGVKTVDASYHGVDWSKTRAYALGLTGLNINLAGREGKGIVKKEDAIPLMEEIRSKLLALKDGDTPVIKSVKFAGEVYSGAYIERSPDIIPFTDHGYRSDWGCVTGCVGDRVIYPNEKHWNGDHCHDPELVKGILFTNWKHEKENPAIIDIAPTVLDLLGLKAPGYMDGRPL
ncbi:nucleotide pyrophosphatase [Candidatus Fermentibacteria bacterium]|nr:MAG: nucleotide pyrophosphatase [Candidatus Fermentibacteria bacterium]